MVPEFLLDTKVLHVNLSPLSYHTVSGDAEPESAAPAPWVRKVKIYIKLEREEFSENHLDLLSGSYPSLGSCPPTELRPALYSGVVGWRKQ